MRKKFYLKGTILGMSLLTFLWFAGCGTSQANENDKEGKSVASNVTPSAEPTEKPTAKPTKKPTAAPTEKPTPEPTKEARVEPTPEPGIEPGIDATNNEFMEGEWKHVDGEYVLIFDGVETYTAIDSYGSYAANYYCDGNELELAAEDGCWIEAYIDEDGDLFLEGVEGYFIREDDFDESDEPTDVYDVNAEDFYGCWEFYDFDEWIYIYGDGTYDFWEDSETCHGPFDYYMDGETIVLDDIRLVLYFDEDNGLVTDRGYALFASEPPVSENGYELDDPVDVYGVNAEDFYGSWEYYDFLERIHIFGDGTYIMTDMLNMTDGPYCNYYMDGNALVMEELGIRLYMQESGDLITDSGYELYRYDETEDADYYEYDPENDPNIGRGDLFEEDGRGDLFD